MDLEELNELCSNIMSFYNYNLKCINLYTYELYKQQKEEQIAKLLVAKNLIYKNIIEKLNGNYEKYFSIYNYCIVYREELIDNELLLYLLQNYKLDWLLNILMMNKELNDDIILSVLDNIDFDKNYLGKKPYDYRYHILKRTEIGEEIKNDILKTYKEEELENTVDEVYLDFLDDCSLNKIYTKEELKNNSEIYKEYIALDTMKNYLNQKVYKK